MVGGHGWRVKDHLQSRWLFPSQKSFKGIAFELIFFEILYTTSKGGGFLLAVKLVRGAGLVLFYRLDRRLKDVWRT